MDFADSAIEKVNKNTEKLFFRLHKSAMKMDFSSTEDYKEIISIIKQNGEIYDSSMFIKEKIIDSDESEILQIQLTNKSRDINDLNNRIQASLNDSSLKNKSYVYIAWKMRPEEYFYVGKAKSSSRTNLSGHGNLLESLKQASYFSMLFPYRPIKTTISNLEASLINLIEYKTDSLPKYNKRKERFSAKDLACADEREDIACLLSELSYQFDK